jgi:demethylmenaquinone methyltransferase/2-methoxy-6-polyprenyl-1,4-benzoquinol methylase
MAAACRPINSINPEKIAPPGSKTSSPSSRPRYDLINDLQSLGLHRRWKRTLVRMAGIHPGDRALDVCCGTGDVAFALRRAGAEVTALDFSPAMLAVADDRARSTVLSRRRELQAPAVKFLCGDALRLPFAGESFDVVTVAYGLRNLADWERGLEEMWRVARPGGRLLVLDFGKPANAIWRRMYFSYLQHFVPWFGRAFCKDAATHAYIFASLQNYPAQRGVAAKNGIAPLLRRPGAQPDVGRHEHQFRPEIAVSNIGQSGQIAMA